MTKEIWFKRKTYGWGWTPATWQGWAVTGLYLILAFAFAATLDAGSSLSEVIFTFVLPLILLTITLVRVTYLKGEPPRWQWGKASKKSPEDSNQ